MQRDLTVFKKNYSLILVELFKRIPIAYNHLCVKNDINPDSIEIKKILDYTHRIISNNQDEITQEKGLKTTSKSILVSMIWLFDYRLYTQNSNRKILTKQLIKTISKGDLFKETGEVGLYLTYKCLYNQAKNLNNK
jgi:hypothetical protein